DLDRTKIPVTITLPKDKKDQFIMSKSEVNSDPRRLAMNNLLEQIKNYRTVCMVPISRSSDYSKDIFEFLNLVLSKNYQVCFYNFAQKKVDPEIIKKLSDQYCSNFNYLYKKTEQTDLHLIDKKEVLSILEENITTDFTIFYT